MTAKDFELIARVIRAHNDPKLAADFADALRATNKQFNRDKFIRACGGTP